MITKNILDTSGEMVLNVGKFSLNFRLLMLSYLPETESISRERTVHILHEKIYSSDCSQHSQNPFIRGFRVSKYWNTIYLVDKIVFFSNQLRVC